MIIVSESARPLKRYLEKTGLSDFAQSMVLKMMLTFTMHLGRMTCSQAAGSVACESVHRTQLTRFLARPRWQQNDFNAPAREALLQMQSGKGKFIFIIDATFVSHTGLTTENIYSTGNRKKRPRKSQRHNKNRFLPGICG